MMNNNTASIDKMELILRELKNSDNETKMDNLYAKKIKVSTDEVFSNPSVFQALKSLSRI